MSLSNTPSAERLHITFFGRRNSGKSSLINALTGQQTALVSDVAGTTTDPVLKAMEIAPLGACVLIDTAGFDDQGALGEQRVQKTRQMLDKTDVALVLFYDAVTDWELDWIKQLKERKIPTLALISKSDLCTEEHRQRLSVQIKQATGLSALMTSALTKENVGKIKEEIAALLPDDFGSDSIVGQLVVRGDVVLLVMPQDIQAPKGRLILPQVQTIRDLLDHQCLVLNCTTDCLDEMLAALAKPPKLIIADSQVFPIVYSKKPPQSLLTSFSVLFAKYKGDISTFVAGASAIESLRETDRVLIAEACTHAPLSEDIGREKIPRLLRKKVGAGLQIDLVSGMDFPQDLSGYALVIHCGACMFNRRYVLTRIDRAKAQGVPITNYGVALAKLSGILDKVVY